MSHELTALLTAMELIIMSVLLLQYDRFITPISVCVSSEKVHNHDLNWPKQLVMLQSPDFFSPANNFYFPFDLLISSLINLSIG